MTDLEMTKLCAEAMGLNFEAEQKRIADRDGKWLHGYESPPYDPLVEVAQAIALVKKFKLCCAWQPNIERWWVHPVGGKPESYEQDLNRAIVVCVAKMQSARTQ